MDDNDVREEKPRGTITFERIYTEERILDAITRIADALQRIANKE